MISKKRTAATYVLGFTSNIRISWLRMVKKWRMTGKARAGLSFFDRGLLRLRFVRFGIHDIPTPFGRGEEDVFERWMLLREPANAEAGVGHERQHQLLAHRVIPVGRQLDI